MSKIYCNVCPADCQASCRMLTEVQGSRIINIKGDPRDAYTKGSLCAKGYAYLERVYAPERVLYPLKQREKGSGKWVRVSWEDALGTIAEKLLTIREEYGNLLPVCLNKYLGTTGILSHSVEGFFHHLGPHTQMVGTPCEAAGTDAMTLNYGKCQKPGPEDMFNSRLIIIWGANPAWTTPHQMRYVFDAQEQGAKIVVIDPLLTATAARSDLYYQIRPGTDGLLALGFAKVLLEKNLLDQQFLRYYTYGWPEYKDYLATVDLKRVSEDTAIPLVDIYELACLYGTTKPATIWLGIGIQRALTGGQNVRAIDSLAALTGNIGKPGGNVHYASYDQLAYAGEYTRLKLPPKITGVSEQHKTNDRRIGTGRFEELKNLEPPLEFMWIAGRNPVAQDPNSNEVREVLKKIPMVVVADQFLTSSAQMADYFLPVATPFEFEDVIISFWHYGAAMNEQAIPPLGECKSDFEIMKQLATTLERLKPGFTSFPIERGAEEWLDRELRTHLYELLGITHYRELRDRYARVNLPPVPWQDHQFPTPSGKYEFLSLQAGDYGVSALPIPAATPPISQAYPFRFLTVRSYGALNSQFSSLESLQHLERTPFLYLHSETAKLKNLEYGDKVKVYNQLGEIELLAFLSLSLPRDVLVAYLGVTDTNYEDINTLLSLSETDLGQIVSGYKGISFTDCFVNLLKVE